MGCCLIDCCGLISSVLVTVAIFALYRFGKVTRDAFFVKPTSIEHKGVVVTGATDGIGLALAKKLAAHAGVSSIVLVGRSADKLKASCLDVQKAGAAKGKGLTVATVQTDIGAIKEGDKQKFLDALKKHDVSLLINNAGVGHPRAQFFDEVSEDTWRSIIRVNIEGLVELCHLTVPHLKARRAGHIINVSSLFGAFPSPLQQTYGASKAFVNAFSVALNHELKGSGVAVTTCMPGLVCSKLSKVRKAGGFAVSAEDFADNVLRHIPGRKSIMVPQPVHAVGYALSQLMPQCLASYLVKKEQLGLRARALKKQAAEGKHE